jgi:hypothetical protein
VTIIAGFPHPNSKRRPFVVSPFPWQDNFEPVTDPSLSNGEKQQHPIHIALKWQHCLKHDKSLTFSKIAKTQGISRARVTQIMNLLKLHPVIQNRLKQLEEPPEIAFFSERRLRKITRIQDGRGQLKAFAWLRRQFRRIAELGSK